MRCKVRHGPRKIPPEFALRRQPNPDDVIIHGGNTHASLAAVQRDGRALFLKRINRTEVPPFSASLPTCQHDGNQHDDANAITFHDSVPLETTHGLCGSTSMSRPDFAIAPPPSTITGCESRASLYGDTI